MLGRVLHRLDELALGRVGVVRAVDGADVVKVRLLEMGLVPGTAVKVIKRAPGGDPLQLQLRGYHLSLRASEAARVSVDES
jgi:ferrous iron transport protein A